MTGERGADSYFRGLEVTNFPDHHNVRVGTKNRTQCRGEGQANLIFHRDLHHSNQFVFDRILDRDDAPFRMIYLC